VHGAPVTPSLFTIREESPGQFRVYLFNVGFFPVGSLQDAGRIVDSLDGQMSRHPVFGWIQRALDLLHDIGGNYYGRRALKQTNLTAPLRASIQDKVLTDEQIEKLCLDNWEAIVVEMHEGQERVRASSPSDREDARRFREAQLAWERYGRTRKLTHWYELQDAFGFASPEPAVLEEALACGTVRDLAIGPTEAECPACEIGVDGSGALDPSHTCGGGSDKLERGL
jgi:hypothetical protein